MRGVRSPAGGGGRARRDAPFVANPARRHPRAGLAAVGVALVASAARGLTAGTCKLRVTMAINAAAAVITFYYPATYMFPACILAGGLVTLYTNRKVVRVPDRARSHIDGPGARPGRSARHAHEQLHSSPVPSMGCWPRSRWCACVQDGRAAAPGAAPEPDTCCRAVRCCVSHASSAESTE